LGDEILVQDRDGWQHHFRVAQTLVVSDSDTRVAGSGDDTRLTLITCYPFRAVALGARQRYVVVATRDEARTPVRADSRRMLAQSSP
jgi:sortase A